MLASFSGFNKRVMADNVTAHRKINRWTHRGILTAYFSAAAGITVAWWTGRLAGSFVPEMLFIAYGSILMLAYIPLKYWLRENCSMLRLMRESLWAIKKIPVAGKAADPMPKVDGEGDTQEV